MAFYKESNNNWFKASKVLLPNNTEITEGNKDEHQSMLILYGWEWHDYPPQEYLDWLEEQEDVMVFEGDLDDFKIAHPNILEQDQI